MRLLLLFLFLGFSRVSLACPTCAPAQEASRIWWVLGPFMLLPFVVAGVVILLLKRHAKLAESPTSEA
jgi:hypothetical protein